MSANSRAETGLAPVTVAMRNLLARSGGEARAVGRARRAARGSSGVVAG